MNRIDEARKLCVQMQKVSLQMLQRYLGIGTAEAMRLVAELERSGVVSAPDDHGRRTVLPSAGEEAPK